MSENDFIKIENIDYILNFYRKSKYDKDQFLITTDNGEFLFVNSSTLHQLKRGKIEDKNIFEKLLEKSIIIDKSNILKVIDKTSKRYDFLNASPSLHIVIPTRRCNQGCDYCFATPDKVNASKEECDMDERIAKKTVEFIMQSPSYPITIEFTGGEALLRFDIVKLMTNYARELNKKFKKDLRITIVTNLTLMTDEIAKWLIDNDVSICTSLDGPKEVHNKNRFILGLNGKANIGSYDLVTNWITKINNMYKARNSDQKVTALMTITRHSLKYYKEIIDEYVKHKMEVVDLRGMMAIGKANENFSTDNLTYSFDEFVEFYKKSMKYIEELRKKGIKIFDRMDELYNTKILKNIPTYHTDYESPWGSAIATLTYYNNGEIYSCHEALGREEFRLGNIFTDSFDKLFKIPETNFTILSSLLESNVICDRCALKPYCSTLPIENYYAQGKFNFNPYKTQRHYETKFYAKKILDEEFKKIKQL